MADSVSENQGAPHERGGAQSIDARAAFARARRALAGALAGRRAEAVAACLLLAMGANLLSALWLKTITNDEFVHIPAGYYHLVAGNFQLNNEHPPLVKMWAALPLLLLQPDERAPTADATAGADHTGRTWAFQDNFWAANARRFVTVTFWTRLMMVLVALALGALIFIYARSLFGPTAAVLAVALYCAEPTVLAHGRVVHTDVAAALVFLNFFHALRLYFEARDARRALRLGLSVGLALVTKFSMIVLPLVVAALALLALWRAPRVAGLTRRAVAAHFGLVALAALLVVNAAYFFSSPPIEAPDVEWVRLKSAPVFGELMLGFAWLSKVVPTYFLFGLYNVLLHNHGGHHTFLLGEYGDEGWWYYFPVAFALKTTLPFLLLTLAALAWSAWRVARRRELKFLWLLAPLAVYLLISLTSRINIGVRHFLPAYPFFFVAGGALLARLLEARRGAWRFPAVGIVALALGWHVFEAARAYPHYVPYVNQLAAGRPGWRLLSDSNVEWGDDVPALAAYLKARGETRVRAALSGGWGTLRYFGVEYIDLVPEKPQQQAPAPPTRYAAIGAGFLNGSFIPGGVPGRMTTEERVNALARYRDRQPEAVFGNSIYLYREE